MWCGGTGFPVAADEFLDREEAPCNRCKAGYENRLASLRRRRREHLLEQLKLALCAQVYYGPSLPEAGDRLGYWWLGLIPETWLAAIGIDWDELDDLRQAALDAPPYALVVALFGDGDV